MRKLLKDPVLQEKFDREGYVVVDLLSHEEAEAFIKLHNDLNGAKGTANTNNNSYELSFFDKDIEAKRYKFKRVYEFMKPYVDKFLDDYSPIIINIFNKHEGTGEVPIHQNWTFVDETKYTSVSVWCPLQDVSRQNGTMEVVPGSHKVVSGIRGPLIPWVFDNLNDTMKEKYMVPLELKLGQVAIIDDGIIHYSGINYTPNERRAIQLIMKPTEAPVIHCYKPTATEDTVNIMEVGDDYFFDFNMWEKPREGKLVDTIQYHIHKLTESELVKLCNQNLQLQEQ